MRVTFDTNVLVYAVDVAAGPKRDVALDLLERAEHAGVVIVLQALAEFFDATTRRKMIAAEEAKRFVNDWSSVFPTVAAGPGSLAAAIDAVRLHGLSFWDAMLWAVADQNDCGVILSEDFQDGRRLGRVQFVNPFDPANRRLVDTILPPV